MDPERLDLSTLRPWKDESAFNRAIDSVVQRASERKHSFHFQLLRMARPALGLAASLALVTWSVAWMTATKSSSQVTQASDPATQLLTWALHDTVPSTTEMYDTFGGIYDN